MYIYIYIYIYIYELLEIINNILLWTSNVLGIWAKYPIQSYQYKLQIHN